MIWSKIKVGKWEAKNKAKDPIFCFLKNKLREVRRDFSLKEISYLKIGGKSDYFFEAKNKEDLIKSVLLARKLNLPHLVVGQASNILFLDSGFRGLVIKNNYLKLDDETIQIIGDEVIAPSGMTLLALVKEAGFQNLGGIEFLANIPGTLAGAVISNAGAFSKEIKDNLLGVKILDENGKEIFLETEKLGLIYRSSIFKGKPKKSNFLRYPIILEVKLKLIRKSRQEVGRLIQSLALIRSKSQPKGFSLGCVFKNPSVRSNFRKELKPGIKGNKISAGFLIDKTGLKNKRQGQILISPQHANFFLNLGRGKSKDFLALIRETKEKVKEKFAIMLEEEIEIIEN